MESFVLARTDIPLSSAAELQQGIAALSRGLHFRESSLDMCLRLLTEAAAGMSGVERVSIWALTGDHGELRCLDLFERGTGAHGKGLALARKDNPRYFQALRSGQTIVADDAFLHPVIGLAGNYLTRFNISAVLDAPIHVRGELQGVLRFEQVGRRLPWTPIQQMFIQAVANMVTLALVEYEAAEAREQAAEANEHLRAVLDAAHEAMYLSDGESGEIIDLNRQAELLLERSRDELSGKHLASLHPGEHQARVAHVFQRLSDGQARQPLVTEVECAGGRRVTVELTARLARLSNGRRLAVSVFRPC